MSERQPDIDVEELTRRGEVEQLWLAACDALNTIERLTRRIKKQHERFGWSKGKAEGILGLLERARREMGPVEVWLGREVGKFWERPGEEEGE